VAHIQRVYSLEGRTILIKLAVRFDPRNILMFVADNQGYPTAGSSGASFSGQVKGMDTSVDVESQGSAAPKRQTAGGHNWCPQVDFNKWYEWSAYYIPILEWLPQYKRTILPFSIN